MYSPYLLTGKLAKQLGWKEATLKNKVYLNKVLSNITTATLTLGFIRGLRTFKCLYTIR